MGKFFRSEPASLLDDSEHPGLASLRKEPLHLPVPLQQVRHVAGKVSAASSSTVTL